MTERTAATRPRTADRANGPLRLAPLFNALRPRQWIKNVLILAAPIAAGTPLSSQTGWRIALTFMAFCLASSAGYLVNDVVDLAVDRAHPIKKNRPLASGRLSITAALTGSALLASAALACGLVVGPRVSLVIGVYLAVTITYSLFLKHQPVFDLASVSFGFLLRAIAGGVAVGVPLSQWFLLVTSFGSLFMVAGKRYAEVHRQSVGDDTTMEKPQYSEGYLRFVLALSATATTVFYVLWSVVVAKDQQQLWAQISVAPFTLAVLRYAVDVDSGRAGAPEDVVLRDRGLQGLALVWLITFGLAAYVG